MKTTLPKAWLVLSLAALGVAGWTQTSLNTGIQAAPAAQGAGTQQGSTITEIVVRGNSRVNTDTILAQMQLKVGQPYVEATKVADEERIRRMGFFKAASIDRTPTEGNNWRLTVLVEEFDEVKEIRIVGNSAIKTEDLLKVVTIEQGKPFNLKEQNSTGLAIDKLYKSRGMFVLIDQLDPLPDSPNTVSIVLREAKVKTVTIQGNTRTNDRVIRRIVKTKPGDVYNEQKWIRELQALLATQWFEKVDYDQRIEESDFNMTVAVKEGKTALLNVGAAIDPRSSIAGQLGFYETNFRGTGQTIGINLSQAINIGGPSVDLTYRNPYMDSKDTSFEVNLYTKAIYHFSDSGFGNTGSLTDDPFTERRTGAYVGFTRPSGDRQKTTLGLRMEGISTTGTSSQTQNFIQQDGTLAVLNLGYTANFRDYDLDPSRGNWYNLTFEPGFSDITKVGGAINDPSILGGNNFYRFTGEWRTYYTPQPPRTTELDAARRVIAFRVLAGAITGKVPFFEQYFAGGSNTVRGYEDDRFWGRNTLLTTLEYRHPLQKGFNIVAFADYGGAWGGYGSVNNFTQSNKFKMNLGYGLGFGFKTPLGPIRLDFAFNDRGKSRTHFQIGTSF